jgi:hypothetical protein
MPAEHDRDDEVSRKILEMWKTLPALKQEVVAFQLIRSTGVGRMASGCTSTFIPHHVLDKMNGERR